MSNKEFVQWLRGFTQGVHHYSLTPKQWDELKEKLKTVDTVKNNSYIKTPGWVMTTTND